LADLAEIRNAIAVDSPLNAAAVVDRVLRMIASLAVMPQRFPAALERSRTGGDLRQALVRPFRIVYEVDGSAVWVHTVRHGARRPARSFPRPGSGDLE